MSYFAELAKIDVSKHVEKKGQFSYLSWPYAVKTLLEKHPGATWEVIRHDSKPYLATETGFFVEVAVTVEGITRSQIHPVLDGRNKPIPKPTAFDINTSIQRCLVKAIALHGLGLYIYAGEDLPAEPPKITPAAGAWEALTPERQEALTAEAEEVKAMLDDGRDVDAVAYIEMLDLDADAKVAFWTRFDSKERSRMKKAHAELKRLEEIKTSETLDA